MKLYKNISKYILILFMILTFIEIGIYMFSESNYYGVYYIVLNILICLSLIIINYNYSKASKVIRLSKNIINLLIVLFNNYFLLNVLNSIYKYVDSSSKYISNVYIISRIVKPILLVILVVISILEIYKIDITKYKVNYHKK